MKCETVCDRLLRDLRIARERHMSGRSSFLTWVMERRMIVREAEFQGVKDEFIKRMHNDQMVRLSEYGEMGGECEV